MTRVGFVGAGRMGAPMVRRLVDAGHEVRALGRTAEKASAVEHLGASVVNDPAAVAEGADAVIVCVFTDDQVREVCLADDLVAAMSPARCSWCTPRAARAPPSRSPPSGSTWSTLRSAAGRTTSRRAG